MKVMQVMLMNMLLHLHRLSNQQANHATMHNFNFSFNDLPLLSIE